MFPNRDSSGLNPEGWRNNETTIDDIFGGAQAPQAGRSLSGMGAEGLMAAGLEALRTARGLEQLAQRDNFGMRHSKDSGWEVVNDAVAPQQVKFIVVGVDKSELDKLPPAQQKEEIPLSGHCSAEAALASGLSKLSGCDQEPTVHRRGAGYELHAGGRLVGVLEKDADQVSQFLNEYGLGRYYDISGFPQKN